MQPRLTARVEINYQRITLRGFQEALRVVALSDLHTPTLPVSVGELIGLLRSANPDVLVLAGDIICKNLPQELKEGLLSVRARAGFAVLGNLEYDCGRSKQAVKEQYRAVGIQLLVNEAAELDGLVFAGLDDYLHGAPDFRIAENGRPGSKATVWISHCPAAFDFVSSDRRRPSVMISGHTHGGQIALFGKALFTPNGSASYTRGWYVRNQDMLYVMKGIGSSHRFPIRLGVKPEILVLDIN